MLLLEINYCFLYSSAYFTDNYVENKLFEKVFKSFLFITFVRKLKQAANSIYIGSNTLEAYSGQKNNTKIILMWPKLNMSINFENQLIESKR